VTTSTTPAPRLIATKVPTEPTAAVLVLHGGAGRGTAPVSPTQLSVLRMVPIAARIAAAGRGRFAVYRLLNAVRGFGADPLSNVRWALDEMAARHPESPVGLVGHSLGGSVALAAGRSPASSPVRVVVALAPWLGGTESVDQLRDTPTLIVHGADDRVTSCAASERFAHRARERGAPVSFVRVERGEHTMLRRMSAFDTVAARYVQACLEPPTRRSSGSGQENLAMQARDTPGDYAL
jgi:alpha-beta hydrolase superfamily lysophospholipase